MKSHRRTRRHFKRKAPSGAYSDRYGPRSLRPPARHLRPSTEADPWVGVGASRGMTAAIVAPTGIAFRER